MAQGGRKPEKKFRNFKKQKTYHSDSESEDDQDEVAFDPSMLTGGNSAEVAPEVSLPVHNKKSSKQAPPVTNANLVEDIDQDDEEKKDEIEAEDDIDIDIEQEDNVEEEDVGVEDLDDLVDDSDADEDDITDNSGSDSDADSATEGISKRRKRNDPTAFANSISKILSSKLSTSKRSDPVLSRSVDASTASRELNEAKLEAKARRKLHAEKRLALEKGRVKDVLGLESTDVSTAEIQEQEKRLKKTAQRGVVKLFNAVRAAQVQGELAREEARKEGVVGMGQREERVNEMSKKSFLDLIAKGGKKTPAANGVEA